ncbi:hypothetical protein K435DRAFT_808699 [Dendrothele bispora CBS 962.96]|uniref:Uncharacterized protein n=1 Tax=Dendrothele bispora (strain CBS 962.96) TaxID=1314807 RepID=A0A4S8L0J8_DENBC|nr:hypothetical protein K435DRAFT_808699 [Dendrothele bispora CBS 962.96]
MSRSSTEEQFLPISVSYSPGDCPFLIRNEWYLENDDDHIQCALTIIFASARHFSEEVLEYPITHVAEVSTHANWERVDCKLDPMAISHWVVYAVMVSRTFVYGDNPDERGTLRDCPSPDLPTNVHWIVVDIPFIFMGRIILRIVRLLGLLENRNWRETAASPH